VSEQEQHPSDKYEPPHVEGVPAEDGPAITAAGASGDDGAQEGPEWRPSGDAEEEGK
jgi:hypothetical protein